MARRLTALQLPKVTAPSLPKLGKKKAAAADEAIEAARLKRDALLKTKARRAPSPCLAHP